MGWGDIVSFKLRSGDYPRFSRGQQNRYTAATANTLTAARHRVNIEWEDWRSCIHSWELGRALIHRRIARR
jgi:hypothetical protein